MENEEPIEETLQPSYQFTPPGRHTYRQQGPYLVCKSCEIQHAVYIGMDKIMVGEDEEGNPIVKRR
jgi:hypothetical protein